MKLQDAVALMHQQGLIDEKEIYGYAQFDSVIGGAVGAAMNLALMTVNGNNLKIFRANIDNSWSTMVLSADKSELLDLKLKKIMFGLQKRVTFTCQGKTYSMLLPAGNAKKIIPWLFPEQ